MSIRIALSAALLMLCASAQAQQASPSQTTTYDTAGGPLVVHSGQPGPRTYAAAPPFADLAHGKAYIDTSDADGYPLLANDFIYADANRDGRISKAEYQRWTSSPR